MEKEITEKKYRKRGIILTVFSIGELVAALAVMSYCLLKGLLTSFQCNLLMGTALALYWVLMDVAEPVALHRFENITLTQKEAYVKYILFDAIGFAGIAYFLFGVGGGGSNSGILGAAVYVVAMRPKRESQKVFYGTVQPDAEEQAIEEDQEPEDAGEEVPQEEGCARNPGSESEPGTSE